MQFYCAPVHKHLIRQMLLQPGDRVFTSHSEQMGTLAEFTSVDESAVFHLDEKLSFVQGAAIGVPYFTAYRALFQK